ncbi:MAG: hypothetical protein GF309_14190 [Candidatus Lokiarchaeota archaeon]|nr:hypothetical protein [Candidatus Lokiarchaeota archaeon]
MTSSTGTLDTTDFWYPASRGVSNSGTTTMESNHVTVSYGTKECNFVQRDITMHGCYSRSYEIGARNEWGW